MSFDERLADRIRAAISRVPDVTERLMFGGICFMLGGNMFVGVVGGDLMVRVGPDAHAAALKRAHARPMDFSGRPMKGYVYVAPAGTATVAQVAAWAERARTHVATLPSKKKASARTAARPTSPKRRSESRRPHEG